MKIYLFTEFSGDDVIRVIPYVDVQEGVRHYRKIGFGIATKFGGYNEFNMLLQEKYASNSEREEKIHVKKVKLIGDSLDIENEVRAEALNSLDEVLKEIGENCKNGTCNGCKDLMICSSQAWGYEDSRAKLIQKVARKINLK